MLFLMKSITYQKREILIILYLHSSLLALANSSCLICPVPRHVKAVGASSFNAAFEVLCCLLDRYYIMLCAATSSSNIDLVEGANGSLELIFSTFFPTS